MAATDPSWAQKFWADQAPTPGRLNSTLRIVLASVITLILLMALQMPFASLGMYYIFLIGRDSPSVSFRSSVLSLVTLAISVAAVFAVVILSDNDPMARVLSVSVVAFIAGMLMFASTLSALASTWGFIYCTLIGLWETHTPADRLVKTSLYLLGTVSVAIVVSVAVEYLFGTKHPADELQQQRRIRYQALDAMFSLYARGASPEEITPAVVQVSRLAGAGQTGMQELYNAIVDRNLDTGTLPIGTRVRITMLAQLMDVAAAFGSQNLSVADAEMQRRCAHIAELCRGMMTNALPGDRQLEHKIEHNPTLLDRVDAELHAILSMPVGTGSVEDKELAALPSKKVPLLIPGALKQKETVAFALKLSLCATLCYILYTAVAWPGISTSVTTVLITGLSSSGAIKQKLIFRFVGSLIGGLILGLGATVFLFPHMDSITSFVLLTAAIAFISAWCAAGRHFNYVGLQIAFAFYLVAFEGFSAPTELAPARDRLIGILLALVVMAFVFDQIWPVRTVTAMRSALAKVMRNEAEFLRLVDTTRPHEELLRQANILRDQVGKTVAGIRTMNEAVEYEFGVDRVQSTHAGQIIIGASLASVAFFWNQFAVLQSEKDSDFLTEPALAQMRERLAREMDIMADAVVHKTEFAEFPPKILDNLAILAHPRFGEYARNSVARFNELQTIIARLRTQT